MATRPASGTAAGAQDKLESRLTVAFGCVKIVKLFLPAPHCRLNPKGQGDFRRQASLPTRCVARPHARQAPRSMEITASGGALPVGPRSSVCSSSRNCTRLTGPVSASLCASQLKRRPGRRQHAGLHAGTVQRAPRGAPPAAQAQCGEGEDHHRPGRQGEGATGAHSTLQMITALVTLTAIAIAISRRTACNWRARKVAASASSASSARKMPRNARHSRPTAAAGLGRARGGGGGIEAWVFMGGVCRAHGQPGKRPAPALWPPAQRYLLPAGALEPLRGDRARRLHLRRRIEADGTTAGGGTDTAGGGTDTAGRVTDRA